MAQSSFFSLNLTNNKQIKGGRSASAEIDYLEKGSPEKELNKIDSRSAESEAEYLEGKDRRREDLAFFKSGNIPEWAHNEALKNGTSPHLEFFKASETYEDPAHVTYREIKLALPKELIDNRPDTNSYNTDKLESLVDDYMSRIGLDKMSYAYAIHIKNAQLSPDNLNPHVHIMWSDRMPDSIERSKEQYFAGRYSSKNPDKGPCRKDNTYSKYNGNTKRIRKTAEQTINDHYIRHGLDHWVCSGNKAEIAKMALERGDMVAHVIAKNVPAQRHVGEKAAANPSHPRTREAMELKALARDIRLQHEIEQTSTTPPQERILSDDINELQKELVQIEQRMTEIKETFFVNLDTTPTIDDKISNDINALKAEINLTQSRIAKSPEVAAMRQFCQDQNLQKEYVDWVSKSKIINNKQQMVDGIEKQITAKYFGNNSANATALKNLNSDFKPEDHCSPKQRQLLINLKEQIAELKQPVKEFQEKHIIPNKAKIEEIYLPKVEARQQGLRNKIAKLTDRVEELERQKAKEILQPQTAQFKQNIDQLFRDYEKGQSNIRVMLQHVQDCTNKLEAAQKLKEQITNREELNLHAVSNLSKTPAETIKIQRQNVATAQQQSAELEKIMSKKPGKLLMLVADDKTKEYWLARENELVTSHQKLIKAQTEYNETLFKISLNNNDRAAKIQAEERAIPAKVEDAISKLPQEIRRGVEIIREKQEDVREIEAKLTEEINRPDKLQIVNGAKQFTLDEARTILNAEVFKLNQERATINDRPSREKLDKRIAGLKKSISTVENQIKRDQRYAAKNKTGEIQYKIKNDTPTVASGGGGGGGSSKPPTDLHAVSTLLKAFEGDSKAVPLTVRIEGREEKDFGMMTQEQIQDYMHKAALDRSE